MINSRTEKDLLAKDRTSLPLTSGRNKGSLDDMTFGKRSKVKGQIQAGPYTPALIGK